MAKNGSSGIPYIKINKTSIVAGIFATGRYFCSVSSKQVGDK
jgi:hypothetical protein